MSIIEPRVRRQAPQPPPQLGPPNPPTPPGPVPNRRAYGLGRAAAGEGGEAGARLLEGGGTTPVAVGIGWRKVRGWGGVWGEEGRGNGWRKK